MRRIPIEFPPVPGESLDSWLLAYAARLGTPLGDLTDALGIGCLFVGQPAYVDSLGRRPPEVAQMAQATGLRAKTLEGLWRPLARYEAVVRRRFAKRRIARAARPMLWSRFCKPCLVTSEGRWPLAWRLPWFVACPVHESLLSSTCPSCGQHQRRRALRHDLEPEPMNCSVPRAGASGRGEHRCGARLTDRPSSAAATSLTLAAQRRLVAMVDPDASDASLNESVEDLADLLTVASFHGLDFETLDGDGLADAGAVASAIEDAEAVLADPTGRLLTMLAMADVRKRPHPLPRRWRTASAPLVSLVLTIRDPWLRPIDRLRWRTTTAGVAPDGRDTDVAAGEVPDALWADWSVRLCPPTGVDPGSFRLVAAAALALPGSRRPLDELVSGRDEDAIAFGRKLSHVFQAVARSEHGRSVLRALTQLSDGLRAHGSPIDYEQRRRIAAAGAVLDLRAWDDICAAAGVPTGGHRKLRNARLWVWELLTGGLPQDAPAGLSPAGPGGYSTYQSFALHLPAIAVGLLEAHARDVLDANGCNHEPMAWSPPTEWVNLDGVPVPDVDAVDVARAAVLLRGNRSPSDVADELGVSLDHVRLLVRRRPDVFQPRLRLRRGSTSAPGAGAVDPNVPRPRNARTIPPPDLTTEHLRALVMEEKRTLRSLAAEYGVGRRYLADRLRLEGIPVPPARRRPVHIVDPEWLRVEYLDHRRTLPDIAAEVGTTAPNIARIARAHGIPLRGRGGPSHADSLAVPAGWPEPLASAVLGQGGKDRVRRFQVYARFRSLNQAAAHLMVHQGVLTTQLSRLEAACGGRLILRSPRSQANQRLTDLGHRLLAQADEYLGSHPDTPLPLPEPFASAMSSFWGVKRVRCFVVAARSKTLAVASSALGTDRYTLDRSIRGLERAVGGVLLQRSSPSQPHALTALGQALLAQVERELASTA